MKIERVPTIKLDSQDAREIEALLRKLLKNALTGLGVSDEPNIHIYCLDIEKGMMEEFKKLIIGYCENAFRLGLAFNLIPYIEHIKEEDD